MRKLTTFLLLLAMLIPTAGAQSTDIFKKKKKKNSKTEAVDKAKADSIAKAKKSPFQPYASVITGKAKTMNGFFKVHCIEGKYFFEIPDSLFGRDILIVNRIVKAPVDKQKRKVGYPGDHISDEVIRFELGRDNKLFIRQISYLEHSTDTLGMYQAVLNSNVQPIVATFPLKTMRKDSLTKNYVIEMTDFIRRDNDMFSFSNYAKDNIGATSMISDASYIDTLKAFPQNIEIRTVRTFQRKPPMGSALEKMIAQYYNSTGPMTYELNSSMLLLPKEPMKPRLYDPRVGYFAVGYKDFDGNPHGMKYKANITRWRLEPKDEDKERYLRGELVEPKKPIVIYIDPATPKKWVPYLIQGVNDWQKAFEKAGFKNAIIAKEITDSMTVDMDDVNYSVLTYAASTKANAMGPSILDPRSGEILEADIMWWHNVLNMLQEWITVQTGTVRPEARGIKLSDELMGDAMRFVACHEVGHSLGLRHNMMGSWAFPTDSLRSKSFTDRMNSTSSSIMDYARFNYVAQPGDGITALSPHIGPYDIFAIEYGYRWYGKENPEEEKDLLYDFLSRHTDRLYKYSEAQDVRDAVDPRAQNEDLGDDAVRSSQYGIANLKRIVPEIIKWTTTGEKGQTYEEASRLYYAVINQWNNYLYHVLANIGGIYIENTIVGDGQKTYTFVEKEKQQAALKFLLDEVLTYPKWLFDTEVGEYTYLLRNTPLGVVENAPTQILKNAQSYILWDLLSNNRLVRMLENEAVNGKKAFTAVELMDGLHRSIFATTERGALPDVMTRTLQKNFLDALITAAAESEGVKINKKLMDNHFLLDNQLPLCSCDEHAHRSLDADRMGARRELNFYGSQLNRISDAISVKRGELLRIKDLLQSRLGTSDVATKYHYKDMILRINTALGL